MSLELVVALLASPFIVGLPAFVLRFLDTKRANRLADEESTLARLEEENVRLANRAKAAEQRVQELEDREDGMRERLDQERERHSRLRRRIIEAGVAHLLEAEEMSGP